MQPNDAPSNSPQRRWNWSRIAIWASVILFISYMILLPAVDMLIQKWSPPKTGQVIEDMSFAEQVRLRTTEAIVAVIFFSFGASVGSFLNVVAYRAPRGRSVAFQRSHCPSCGALISGRDNVPILGWLLLNGKCRDCQEPISRRYPAVETVAAVLFLALYFIELISGGANIPVRRPNLYNGVVWILLYTKWNLVRLYLFHCFSLSALLTWTLIDIDKQKIPNWLRLSAALVLGMLPAIWPKLLPVHWWCVGTTTSFSSELTISSAIVTSVLGALAGAAMGWFSMLAIPSAGRNVSDSSRRQDDSTGFAAGHSISAGLIVGLALGWQGALGVWLLTLLLRPIISWASRWANVNEPRITLVVFVAFFLQLIGWRLLSVFWWPSAGTTPTSWAILSLVFAGLWGMNRTIPQQVSRQEETNPHEKIAEQVIMMVEPPTSSPTNQSE